MRVCKVILATHPNNRPPQAHSEAGLEIDTCPLQREIGDHESRCTYLSEDAVTEFLVVVNQVDTERIKPAFDNCRPYTLARIIAGEMRTGVSDGLVQDAIGLALGAEASVVRRAALFLGDLAAVAELAARGGASGFSTPHATFDVDRVEAGRLRDCQLAIVGGHERRAHRHVRGRDMQQIQAAREELGRIGSRELTRARENRVEIQGHSQKPLAVDVLLQLRLDGPALLPADQTAPHQELEGVGNLKLMELGERNLRRPAKGLPRGPREALWHIDRHERARVDVRRHRSPRLSLTTADAPGVTMRSPKTARARASRSGQGATGPTGRMGPRRATGRRRRVTSMI